jgi:uncharacterized protein YqgC (DUF456 family)
MDLVSLHTLVVGTVALLCVLAYLLTLAPLIPGSAAVFAAALVWGAAESFAPFAWYFWAGQIALTGVYLVIDNVAQHYGVKRIGGSRSAIWGGVIGVVAGTFVLAPVLGPLAIILGPPAGAVTGVLAGQALHRRRARRSAARIHAAAPASGAGDAASVDPGPSQLRLAVGALGAYVVGTAAKLAIITAQVLWLVVVIH